MYRRFLIAAVVIISGTFCCGGYVLTWDGQTDIEEVSISLSETAELGIYAEEEWTAYEIAIQLSNSNAILDISGISDGVWWPEPGPYVKDSSDLYVDVTGGDFFGSDAGQVIWGIELLPQMEGELTISLIATGDNIVGGVTYPAGTLFDTIDVTVVPEPMTVVLLGLGGVFLRRRKWIRT